jgi:hypothetical protein
MASAAARWFNMVVNYAPFQLGKSCCERFSSGAASSSAVELLFFRHGVFYAAVTRSARGLAWQAPILPQLGRAGQ